MSSFTSMNGVLRIYDSTDTGRANAVCDVQLYDAAPSPTFSDKTDEAESDDASATGAFCATTDDAVYVGCTAQFCRIKYSPDTAGAGTGAIIATYYNGSTWASLDVTDGTDDGTDCFAQAGVISFKAPSDWAVGGDAELSSTKYYVKLMATSAPGTPPDADQLWPVDGLYYELHFCGGDLTAPEARPRPEETHVLDRGSATTSYIHTVLGDDAPLVEGIEMSFTARVADDINGDDLLAALACGNPGVTTWNATGTTTKGDTTITNGDGTTCTTPAFEDASKKTVCVQILWTRSISEGRAYHEVWFDPASISIQEAADGVTISMSGLIFGKPEVIYSFGYQF